MPGFWKGFFPLTTSTYLKAQIIIIIRWQQAAQSLILGLILSCLKRLWIQSLPLTRVCLYILDDLYVVLSWCLELFIWIGMHSGFTVKGFSACFCGEEMKSPLCFELGCLILDKVLVLRLLMTCFYACYTRGFAIWKVKYILLVVLLQWHLEVTEGDRIATRI